MTKRERKRAEQQRRLEKLELEVLLPLSRDGMVWVSSPKLSRAFMRLQWKGYIELGAAGNAKVTPLGQLIAAAAR